MKNFLYRNKHLLNFFNQINLSIRYNIREIHVSNPTKEIMWFIKYFIRQGWLDIYTVHTEDSDRKGISFAFRRLVLRDQDLHKNKGIKNFFNFGVGSSKHYLFNSIEIVPTSSQKRLCYNTISIKFLKKHMSSTKGIIFLRTRMGLMDQEEALERHLGGFFVCRIIL